MEPSGSFTTRMAKAPARAGSQYGALTGSSRAIARPVTSAEGSPEPKLWRKMRQKRISQTAHEPMAARAISRARGPKYSVGRTSSAQSANSASSIMETAVFSRWRKGAESSRSVKRNHRSF